MTSLVLLSGWGCDARIWQPLAPCWPAELEVTTPDWPGYAGRPPLADPASLGELATAMAADLPADAVWVGWSLGGLLAGALLDYLPNPRALVLLGIGERFVQPEGVSAQALADFRHAFERSPDAAREHFLRWQLGGEPDPRRARRDLRQLLGTAAPASTETLDAGLDQLARLDNRHRLDTASCPVHRIAGARDPLLAGEVRASADQQIADAGHCPMLSGPQHLATSLAAIADTHRSDREHPEPTS
ncbi:alpha/beta fold hydrolase [Halomonas sabkhae]|uniref:alpha/beta fold hydrolase n=1 Tax=Halomonas sabkhae TaxID=626223 RepID=UPI0025B40C87|nr:alpha/beta fold hydrolase [Halomonas sabkhae]MDN3523721.1 alpha/beta fold hydrolase [Halomonas sabkhae]